MPTASRLSAFRRWPWELLLHPVLALLLLRPALRPGVVPGVDTSEAWGRLFVTRQVTRWLQGRASPGWADLLNWPVGQTFWPVDPVVQAVQAPLALLVGDAAALTAVVLGLSTLAGIGTWALARAAGAGRLGSLAAGLVVQLAPFVLRNLHDVVVEVLALGLLALAARACLLAVRAPGRRSLLAAGAWILVLAGASPYFAVYLALGAAVSALATPRRWRGWAALAGVGALACGLAAAPLLWTEAGEHGRLGPHYAEGYGLRPTGLVDGAGVPADRPSAPPPRSGQAVAPSRDGPAAGPPPVRSPWRRLVDRFPAGLAVGLAAVAGLATARGRPWAALAFTFFLAGPGPTLTMRYLGRPGGDPGGLLDHLLSALPTVGALGNPTRVLAVVIVAAAVAGALAATRWRPLAVLLAGVALAEAASTLAGFRVPATALRAEAQVLARVEGPVVVFPSGDPPCWHPWVAPKEAIGLAALAGQPTAYDYGRGRVPADLTLQVALTRAAGTVIGRQAWQRAAGASEEGAGFSYVLVLDDRLTPPQRERLHAWLAERAMLLAEGAATSAWRLTSAPPAP